MTSVAVDGPKSNGPRPSLRSIKGSGATVEVGAGAVVAGAVVADAEDEEVAVVLDASAIEDVVEPPLVLALLLHETSVSRATRESLRSTVTILSHCRSHAIVRR